MRISDWSSDVCSSDLAAECREKRPTRQAASLCSEVLHELPRRVAGGPGPLEIVTAEPTGDVEALADEIEAGHLLCREGLGGERGGVDAAGGHLGGAESFCTAGPQAPAVQQPGYRAQDRKVQRLNSSH